MVLRWMLRCVGRSIQSCLASRLAQTAAHWCEQNAALTVMTVLLSRVLLYFKLNLYIPLSKVLYMSLLQPLYSPSLQPLYMPLFARNVYMPLSEALPPSTTLGAKSIGGGGVVGELGGDTRESLAAEWLRAVHVHVRARCVPA